MIFPPTSIYTRDLPASHIWIQEGISHIHPIYIPWTIFHFKPMFRPMFRNKVTFEKWPPNTKYALGGLGSYRNKVTFYIKGNLKGNLISEHACERACVHAHERACVHAYVRAYMRMCDPFVRPLNAPSRGWARPQNCTGFEYQQLCTSILGLYK